MMYVYTPDILKKEIDRMVEEKGFKFFLLSSNLDGAALAPSQKKKMYKVPVAVPDVFNPGYMNVPKMCKGFYMIGVADESSFAPEVRGAVANAVQRSNRECGDQDIDTTEPDSEQEVTIEP